MFMLYYIFKKFKKEFAHSRKDEERGTWFIYTLIPIIIPFTSSKTSNLFRSLKGLFGFTGIRKKRYYTFMASPKIPWQRLWQFMGRGIERRKIFRSNIDRNDFIGRLSALAQDGAMEIYAWVLMPEHFHILCKTKNLPLASSMRRILTGYVVNFNRRHRRYGHLFQNRYKSIVGQEDVYLKELVRYIHLNLLRAWLRI